jgi:hypothetical protein
MAVKKLELSSVISSGRALLIDGLKKYPPFDPTKEYKEKNDYVDYANQAGLDLMRSGLHNFAELYYEALCQVVEEYEQVHQVKYNKGIIYANLGVCQILNGKFTSGMAYLLSAEQEDKLVNPTNYDILNEVLWRYFELPYIYPFLCNLNTSPNADLSITIDVNVLDNFFKNLERQERIFLQGTLWEIIGNLEWVKTRGENLYTVGKLFSNLRDLCLIIEMLLKKNYLGNKLDDYLKKVDTRYPTFKKSGGYSSSISLEDFLTKLDDLISHSPSELRRLHILHLVRNFLGHQFDISETTISKTSGKNFIALYEPALHNILAALIDLHHNGHI